MLLCVAETQRRRSSGNIFEARGNSCPVQIWKSEVLVQCCTSMRPAVANELSYITEPCRDRIAIKYYNPYPKFAIPFCTGSKRRKAYSFNQKFNACNTLAWFAIMCSTLVSLGIVRSGSPALGSARVLSLMCVISRNEQMPWLRFSKPMAEN